MPLGTLFLLQPIFITAQQHTEAKGVGYETCHFKGHAVCRLIPIQKRVPSLLTLQFFMKEGKCVSTPRVAALIINQLSCTR